GVGEGGEGEGERGKAGERRRAGGTPAACAGPRGERGWGGGGRHNPSPPSPLPRGARGGMASPWRNHNRREGRIANGEMGETVKERPGQRPWPALRDAKQRSLVWCRWAPGCMTLLPLPGANSTRIRANTT